VFELPEGAGQVKAAATIAGSEVKASLSQTGSEARLLLGTPATVSEGETIEVALIW
jgi:hypothetical protein